MDMCAATARCTGGGGSGARATASLGRGSFCSSDTDVTGASADDVGTPTSACTHLPDTIDDAIASLLCSGRKVRLIWRASRIRRPVD